jgi:hypothetical protein
MLFIVSKETMKIKLVTWWAFKKYRVKERPIYA